MKTFDSRPAPRRRGGTGVDEWARARKQAMREWRRIDMDPIEKAWADSATPLAKLVPSALADLGLDRKKAEAEIVNVWKTLMDPDVAAHAQPVNLHKGTLFVSVDSSVWLDEIVRYRRGTF